MLLNVFSKQLYNEGQKLRKRLKEKIHLEAKKSADFRNSFDVVGDIAITRLPTTYPAEDSKTVGEAIMSCNKGIMTVLAQYSKVSGEYRLRNLSCIAGENKTRTLHREHGCVFYVDLKKCYFSPRLSGERLRIARLVHPEETVVNMFAGVGCFSILIAKTVPTAKVYSIDINPDAVKFMQENIKINRVYRKVVPLLGDSKVIIENRLQRCADRVLMPLPEKALEYLPCAVSALKVSGGWIHCYCFEHADKTEDPKEKVKVEIAQKLKGLGVDFDVPLIRVVRPIGPNWHQVVADVNVEC